MSALDLPSYDALVIGGSQTGLAVGYYLARQGLSFVILEAGPDSGHVWRSRWDSLTLFTPRRYSGLPGMPFPGPPGGYPSRDEAVTYLERYRTAFDLPVRFNTEVKSLTRSGDVYCVMTHSERFVASQVVIATGPFRLPFVPGLAAGADPDLAQMHSVEYRNPEQLPPGHMLVVGGGNSGYQIAEELAKSRTAHLAVGRHMPALPQRFLGRDLFWWLTRTGLMRVNRDTRLGRRMSQRDFLIGSSARRLRRARVTMHPRLEEIQGRRAVFADSSTIDVDGIVWATGYRSDYSWIQVPDVIDEHGAPVHARGVTAAAGLYFVGLSWQYTRGSALIGFMKDDAAFIVEALAATSEGRLARASSPSGPSLASPAGWRRATSLPSR